MEKRKRSANGLTVVFTGNGKGKTSAAMGILARAKGQGLRVGVIQFIKSPELTYGEAMTAARLQVPFQSMGDGFVFNHGDRTQAHQAAEAAWGEAQCWITGQNYDVVILDEFTYMFTFGWLDVNEVISWLKANKPPALHLVVTGRNAPGELIDYADMVTEMQEIKHPFKEKKLPAQLGIDY